MKILSRIVLVSLLVSIGTIEAAIEWGFTYVFDVNCIIDINSNTTLDIIPRDATGQLLSKSAVISLAKSQLLQNKMLNGATTIICDNYTTSSTGPGAPTTAVKTPVNLKTVILVQQYIQPGSNAVDPICYIGENPRYGIPLCK